MRFQEHLQVFIKQFIPGVFFHSFQYPKIHGLENTWQGHRCPQQLGTFGFTPTGWFGTRTNLGGATDVTETECTWSDHFWGVRVAPTNHQWKENKSQMIYTNYILPSVPPSHHNRFLLISYHKISIIYLPQCIHFTISLVPSRAYPNANDERKISHLPIILATALQPSHVRVRQQESLAESLFRLVHFYPHADFLFMVFLDKTFASHEKHSVSCAGWKKIKQSSRVTKYCTCHETWQAKITWNVNFNASNNP